MPPRLREAPWRGYFWSCDHEKALACMAGDPLHSQHDAACRGQGVAEMLEPHAPGTGLPGFRDSRDTSLL